MAAVACLVPAYNHAPYVEDAIRSIDGDVEVVAVDDASRDETFAVLTRLAAEVPNLRVLRNERNLGGVGTVLRALAGTTAPYVTVLASDDRWLPGRAARQVAVLDAGAQWSFGQAHVIDAAGTRTSREPQGAPPDPDGTFRTLLRGQGIYAPTLMYRRDLLERAGGLRPALWEDLMVTLRFAALAEPVFLAEPLVEYRLHGANAHLDLVDRGLHVTAQVECIDGLLEWPGLPDALRPVVLEHAAVWEVLARLERGQVRRRDLRGVAPGALAGVVRRQARDLLREIEPVRLRRFEALLRLAGHPAAARELAEARGRPRWRQGVRRVRKRLGV